MFEYCLHHPQLLHALILIFALATTLLALNRSLPLQNVIAIGCLIGFFSGVAELFGVRTGFPFGHFFYARFYGWRFLGLLPWPVPCLWIVVIINSRGVARLILRRWRHRPDFGLRVIVLTCVLATLFDVALEPFGFRVNHYWNWRAHDSTWSWYGVPWTNFVGWAFTTLLLLIITFPWFMDKKRLVNPPPDFYPLLIWVVLALLLALMNTTAQLWSASLFTLLTTVLITFLALIPARRRVLLSQND